MRHGKFIVWQQLFMLLSSMALGKPIIVAARVLVGLALLGVITILCADLPARADPEPRAMAQATGGVSILTVRVVDGTTLEDTRTHARYGLANIEAAFPCASEQQFDERAAAATEALVGRARNIMLTPTNRIDAAGRALVFVSLDGRDLGELLMAQGAVRPARASAEPSCDAANLLL